MADENIHIALAANHHFIKGLEATVASLVQASSNKERIRFYIFSDGLTNSDVCRVQKIAKRFGYNVPIDFRVPDIDSLCKKFKAFRNGYTAYIRLFFPVLLPELDYVLWVDADTLWFKDPAALWYNKNDRVSLQWCKDVPSTRKSSQKAAEWRDMVADWDSYGCSGVVLMNLKRMRECHFVESCDAFLKKWGTPLFHDQDILNAVCSGDTELIDPTWNLLYPIREIRQDVVLHFNCISAIIDRDKLDGFSPLFEIWFRYYAQVIEGKSGCEVTSLGWRIIYFFLSLLYPCHRGIACLTDPIHPWVSDFVQRTILFSRIRRMKLWE